MVEPLRKWFQNSLDIAYFVNDYDFKAFVFVIFVFISANNVNFENHKKPFIFLSET